MGHSYYNELVLTAVAYAGSEADMFNQSFKNVTLPENLEELRLGHRYNRSLEGVQLPRKLKQLGNKKAVASTCSSAGTTVTNSCAG